MIKLNREKINENNYSENDYSQTSLLFSTIQSFMKEERNNPVSEAFAEYALGLCYRSGEGVTRNDARAVELYRKAAVKGNDEAQNNLGYCYHHGRGVTQSGVQAVEWYRKAAEQGNDEAQNNLGYCYHHGRGVGRDDVQAVEWLRKATEQGNAAAQNNLGNCYHHGRGVTPNGVLAVKWYRKAADHGNAAAQNNLGNCYHHERGVTQNWVLAIEWYRKSAEQGNAEAQNNLGSCYHHGYGVTKNEAQGVKWYRKAAEQGHEAAQNNLGNCYFHGRGVGRDDAQAVEWLRKAANQGRALAQINLGSCCLHGYGVGQNYAQAARWYKKAAEQGNVEAESKVLELCLKKIKKESSYVMKFLRDSERQQVRQHALDAICGIFYKNTTEILPTMTEKSARLWFKAAVDHFYFITSEAMRVSYDTEDSYETEDKRVEDKLSVFSIINDDILIGDSSAAEAKYILDKVADSLQNTVHCVFISAPSKFTSLLEEYTSETKKQRAILYLLKVGIEKREYFLELVPMGTLSFHWQRIYKKAVEFLVRCNPWIICGVSNMLPRLSNNCIEGFNDIFIPKILAENEEVLFRLVVALGGALPKALFRTRTCKKHLMKAFFKVDGFKAEAHKKYKISENPNTGRHESDWLSDATSMASISKKYQNFVLKHKKIWLPLVEKHLEKNGAPSCENLIEYIGFLKIGKSTGNYCSRFDENSPLPSFPQSQAHNFFGGGCEKDDVAAEDYRYLASLLEDPLQPNVHDFAGGGSSIQREAVKDISPAAVVRMDNSGSSDYQMIDVCDLSRGGSSRQKRGVKRGASQMSASSAAKVYNLSGGGSSKPRKGIERDASQMSASTPVVCDPSGADVREELVAHVIPPYFEDSVTKPIAEEPLENSDNTKLASEDDLYQSAQNMRKKIIFYLGQNDLCFCHDNVERLMEQNRCGLNLKREPKSEEDVLQQLFDMFAKGGENQSVFFELMSLLVEFFSSEDEFSIDEIKSFKELLIGYQGNFNVNALITTVEKHLSELENFMEGKQDKSMGITGALNLGCKPSHSDDKTMGVKKPDRSPEPSVAPGCSGASSSSGGVDPEPKRGRVESSQPGTNLIDVKSFFTEDSSSFGEQAAQASMEESQVDSDASILSSSTESESESESESDQSEDPLPNEAGFLTAAVRLAKALKPSEEDLTVDYCYAQYVGAGEHANNPSAGNCHVNYPKYASDDAQWSEIVSKMNLEYYRAQNKSSVSEQINKDVEECLDIVERLKSFLREIKKKVSAIGANLGYHLRVRVNNKTQDEFGISVTVFDYCVRVISFYHKLPVLLKSLQKEGLCDLKKNQSELVSSIASFSRDEGEGLGLLASRVMMKPDVCFNIDDLNGLIGDEGGAVSFWYYLLTIHPDYLVRVGERYDDVAGLLKKLERLGFNKGNMTDASLKTRKARMYGTYYHRAPGKDNIIRVIPNQFSGAWDIKYNAEEGQGIKVQSINHFQSLRKRSSKVVPVLYSPQKNKEQDHLGRLLGGKLMDFMLRTEYEGFYNWNADDKKAVRESYSSDALKQNGKFPFIVGIRKGFWALQQYRNSTHEFWASIMFSRSLNEGFSFPLNGDAVSCRNLLKQTVVEPDNFNGIMLGALKLHLNEMDLNAGNLWLCVSGMSTLGSESKMTINCEGGQEHVKVQTCFSTIFLSVRGTRDEAEQEKEQQRLAGLLDMAVANGLAGGFGD